MSAGTGVELDRLRVQFGDFIAVRDASVSIGGGEFFSFLGPSGCGKTTILRTVSGFQDPSSGRVLIGGRDMAGIGPNRRPTALIFQNLALFPLMRVWENITFAMEVKRASKAERRKRADELLELIALSGQGDKFPNELSGGQRQRVAVARALCAEPDVLLLDEPLSALDLKLRQHMRSELRAIQQRVGITFIYITHDQGEALTMSDHVAVMREGVIEQVADGRTIYDDPATTFVASFVGENNCFTGRVARVAGGEALVETPSGPLPARMSPTMPGTLSKGDEAMVFIRPEVISVSAPKRGQPAGAGFEGVIEEEEFEGPNNHLFVRGPDDRPVKVSLVNRGHGERSAPGTKIRLSYEPAKAIALPKGKLAAD
jgi:spermidine/putrescine transport system ATP-binding protein